MAAPRKPPTPKPPPRKPPPKPPILADAESVTSGKVPIAAPATIASVLVRVAKPLRSCDWSTASSSQPGEVDAEQNVTVPDVLFGQGHSVKTTSLTSQ